MKLHLLDLGFLEYDEGWPLAAARVSTRSDPAPASPRREVAIIAALIEHPKAGPILFDTGAATGFRELWPPIVQELFAITTYEREHQLDAALEATGFGIDDISAVVMSHLHLDHAGGLELFRGRDTFGDVLLPRIQQAVRLFEMQENACELLSESIVNFARHSIAFVDDFRARLPA